MSLPKHVSHQSVERLVGGNIYYAYADTTDPVKAERVYKELLAASPGDTRHH